MSSNVSKLYLCYHCNVTICESQSQEAGIVFFRDFPDKLNLVNLVTSLIGFFFLMSLLCQL